MARTITGNLEYPTGVVIPTGTIRFIAEQSSTDTPKGTSGDITVTNGAYSGDINDGIYTVKLYYPHEVTLGTSVAVVAGSAVDVLTLCGLDDVPPTIAQTILAEMQALADQTALDAVATAADAVATAADRVAVAAEAAIVLTALGDIDAALDTINGEVI